MTIPAEKNEKVNYPVLIHIGSVVPAMVASSIIIAMKKGTSVHKATGKMFVTCMTVGSISSFWIHEVIPGHFSPIHGLSVYTLYSLYQGVQAIKAGNVVKHRANMLGSVAGLFGAGIFTMMPSRRMEKFFSSGHLPWIDVEI